MEGAVARRMREVSPSVRIREGGSGISGAAVEWETASASRNRATRRR
jgi:hypothetical protein